MDRERAIQEIIEERGRQESLHPWTTLEQMPIILTEEFLEVIRALQGEGDIEEELVHVAAVCMRWLEKLGE